MTGADHAVYDAANLRTGFPTRRRIYSAKPVFPALAV